MGWVRISAEAGTPIATLSFGHPNRSLQIGQGLDDQGDAVKTLRAQAFEPEFSDHSQGSFDGMPGKWSRAWALAVPSSFDLPVNGFAKATGQNPPRNIDSKNRSGAGGIPPFGRGDWRTSGASSPVAETCDGFAVHEHEFCVSK